MEPWVQEVVSVLLQVSAGALMLLAAKAISAFEKKTKFDLTDAQEAAFEKFVHKAVISVEEYAARKMKLTPGARVNGRDKLTRVLKQVKEAYPLTPESDIEFVVDKILAENWDIGATDSKSIRTKG